MIIILNVKFVLQDLKCIASFKLFHPTHSKSVPEKSQDIDVFQSQALYQTRSNKIIYQ